MKRVPEIRMFPRVLLALAAGAALCPAQSYSGPRPPKPDVAYLLHADNLVETEAREATEEKRKSDTVYRVPGVSSSARTPLAEPIFLFDSQKISPDDLELYKLEVRGGNREATFSQKRRKEGPHSFHLSVTKLDGHLYRVEVNAGLGLDSGEYALTPRESNRVFCFQVY